jgi:phage FluMu protein Com
MNSPRPGATNRAEARCECGQLIAKLRHDGVELKCKRCKRIVVIPYSMVERDAELAPNIRL